VSGGELVERLVDIIVSQSLSDVVRQLGHLNHGPKNYLLRRAGCIVDGLDDGGLDLLYSCVSTLK
jgi:hypothetical protein